MEIEKLTMLEIADIKVGRFQPRTKIDKNKLKDLASSIERDGLLVPIVVRPTNHGSTEYEVICGSRRLSAFKLLGKTKIPAVIKNVTNTQVLGMALAENLHRKDLTPLERAQAYKHMVEEYGYTQKQVGEIVGYHRAEISKILNMISVPCGTLKALEKGDISMSHARTLTRLKDTPILLTAMLEYVIEEGLSSKKTDSLVSKLLKIQDDPEEIKILISGDKDCSISHTISTGKDSQIKITLQHGRVHLDGNFKREELPEILNRLESYYTITQMPDSILEILLNVNEEALQTTEKNQP